MEFQFNKEANKEKIRNFKIFVEENKEQRCIHGSIT